MSKTAPFEEHTERYEEWFEEHDDAYRSELAALDRLVPATGRGVEIGVGSGRFAAPLGIDVGIDPAEAMLERARERDVDVVRGVAESLPFRDGTFDTALMVTTVCFVDDLARALAEANRVLSRSGRLMVGYIDEDSPVGEIYKEHKDENPFYRDATFVSTDELLDALEAAGFSEFEFVQTIYRWLDDIDGTEPVEEGYGEGSFVGIRAGR
ncbi:class I SAM-dependent methyltransferase [Natronomonas sp. LN261]|uniref:class I SAM-dependent methyltransferase n=1 Tax=Natronomonas sp. LN261 TaxID=2750669 RepID=UPI0015EE3D01|nr:class I SAM-dependent methyltransferase [Natronomonas sp. LN261]